MWKGWQRDEKGYGDPDDAPDEENWDLGSARTYWRRRFLILCGGVAALGVCAWVFPAAHQSAHPSAAAGASMAALASRQALPPAATGSAWPVPTPSPSHVPTPSASPSPSGTAPAKLAATARSANQKISLSYKPRAGASDSAGAPTGPASATAPSQASGGRHACAPGDIVLSLFTSKSSYTPGEHPVFSVYAVSTAGSACTMPYGAGSVRVVVTRHGQVVWDSASCKPRPARPAEFKLGVPQQLNLTWNRGVSEPAGCAGSLPKDAAGTLDAVAMKTGGTSSKVTSFKVAK